MASPKCTQNSNATDKIADKMNQTLSFGIIQLLRIIMSPMSKQDQQREALSSLRSNPGLLLALLKIGLEKTPSDGLTRTLVTKSEHRVNRNKASPSRLANTVSAKTVQQPEHSTLSTNQTSSYNSEGLHCENNRQIIEKELISATTNNKAKAISKRKRKTQDDSSSDREKDQCPLLAKYKNKHHKDNPVSDTEQLLICSSDETSCSSTDDQSEKLVVKKMIDILMNPLTVHHQQTVLAVLRSDEKLRNLFFKEKEHLSHMKIPVFRNSVQEKISDQGISQKCAPSIPIVENAVAESPFFSVPSHSTSSLSSDSDNSFLHISESDLTYSCENLQESTNEIYGPQTSEEAIFDSALHEHFIDLSQELYLINNVSVDGNQTMDVSTLSEEINCMTSQHTG